MTGRGRFRSIAILWDKGGGALLAASRQLVWLFLGILLVSSPAFGKERLVSVILPGNLERYRLAEEAFETRLVELPPLGNLRIYVQNPNPDTGSLANSARKAVALEAELIIAYGAQAAAAAQREVRNTPVLFADVYDPLNLDLVHCTQESSCNFSGISASTPVQTLIRTFLAINPDPGRIGLLYSSTDPGSALQCQRLSAMAAQLGIEVEFYDLLRHSALPETLGRIAAECSSLFISDSALVQLYAGEVLQFARERQLLVLSQVPGLCDRGALLTLEPNPSEQGIQLADYAHAVLSGRSVRSLPVVSPKKVDLVINLSLAKKQGLKVPFEALTLATRIVK